MPIIKHLRPLISRLHIGLTLLFLLVLATESGPVSAQANAQPEAVGWVGDMYPGGGHSRGFVVGDASGLTVYVQVYKAGVTGANNGSTGAGIDCFLHWGEFGVPWADMAMSFNPAFGGNGNNDEYMATIPTGTLAVGSYGYTAYCTDDGGSTQLWRDNDYFSFTYDGGNGILSILPPATPPPGTAFVHLFEWPWNDIAKECPYLASKGYAGIQVSPPAEHIPALAPDYPWWVRYQTVSYSLNSRSGTAAEFQAMLNACNAVGVGIYVDAVINHMAAVGSGTGNDGTPYAPYDYADFDPADFHYCNTASGTIDEHNIFNFWARYEVQNCELLNLADLDTSNPTVQATLRAYMQTLIDMGVAGFRIDAAKHMASHELNAIVSGLTSSPYIFQEVIDLGAEQVRSFEYVQNGDVTEFSYSQRIADAFTDNVGGGCPAPNLSGLAAIGSGNVLASDNAVVFTDNHDNQRGHGAGGGCIVDHQDGVVYDLANVFMLAHPYGYPKVMSSFYWDGVNGDQGPPGAAGVTLNVYDGMEPAGSPPNRCADGSNWVCEHRRTPIANMVGFRAATTGAAVVNWWDNGANQIGFERDGLGFVGINREASVLVRSWVSGLPAGLYCNVVDYDFVSGSPNRCVDPASGLDAPAASMITVLADGTILDVTLPSDDAFAIHINAMMTQNPTAINGSETLTHQSLPIMWALLITVCLLAIATGMVVARKRIALR